MTDAYIKATVAAFLVSKGLRVEEIPRSETEKRPDLLVQDLSANRYLIEIKEKLDSPVMIQEYEEQLSKGEMVVHGDTAERKGVISYVMQEACRQLDAFSRPDDYGIVWLYARGWHPSLQELQIRSSVYGTRWLVDREDSRDNRECFYFCYNDFFLFRESLDGAVVHWDEEGQLLVNNHSPRYSSFLQTPFVKAFGSAAQDPIHLEEKEQIYLADCNVPRSDSKKVLDYVREKYCRPGLIDLEREALSATMPVPHPDNSMDDSGVSP